MLQTEVVEKIKTDILCSLPPPFPSHREKGAFDEIMRRKYGRTNSVGKATDYGLDGPRSNPGGDEIFRPS